MKNRKNKAVNFLKIGVFLFGISLFLWNCENDEYILNEENKSIKISYISKDKLNSNESLKNKLEKVSFLKNKQQSRGNSEDIYNFTIITDKVKYAEKGAYHSYTFPISRDTESENLENLLLTLNSEGNYDAVLVGYDFTALELINITSGELEIREVTYTPIDIDTDNIIGNQVFARGGCVQVWQYRIVDDGDEGNLVGEGNEEPFEYAWVLVSNNCFNNSGGGDPIGNGDNQNDSSSNTNNTGGSSTDTSNNETITSPVGITDEDCPLVPITKDLNKDCTLEFYESCLYDAGVRVDSFSQLTSNLDAIKDFINLNGCSQETSELIFDFIEILEEIPDAKFDRYKELINKIKLDPFTLLKDCIQENGLDIANYQFLYNHTLPQSCTDKLDNLGSDFQDQPLNTGNAAVANVDYYGVEITTNPDFNLDGNPDTNAEVFNAYKAKFTDLASGSKNDFQFSCDVPFDSDDKADISWTFSPYYPADATIWNSSNPLTAIIRIDAWGDVVFSNLVSDDGAIMISAFTSQYWIGSTVQTFITGSQPFSGNRQWGHLTNQNGNLELYARAVDVARVSDLTLFGPGTDECKEETYYNIGDETWSNLQEEIKDWINAYNGQASVVPKTAVRFDKTKLKELLENNETINQIDCN